MLQAYGLLIFQAYLFLIISLPAKLYKYLRAGRPILAPTDKQGDTAKILIEASIKTLATLDDKDAINTELLSYLIC